MYNVIDRPSDQEHATRRLPNDPLTLARVEQTAQAKLEGTSSILTRLPKSGMTDQAWIQILEPNTKRKKSRKSLPRRTDVPFVQ